MTEQWFFGSRDWAEYLAAYGRPHDPHYGTEGNLVITLGPEKHMWTEVRKGHQAAIRKAQQTLRVKDGDFDEYQRIHLAVNGHVRPDATFDLMHSWLPDNAFVLTTDGAAAYFIVPKAVFMTRTSAPMFINGSYYASGPRDAAAPAGAAHLLVWTAMKRLWLRGIHWLDMGAVPGERSTDKERSIAHFKRGFGGSVMRWPYV